MGRIKGKSHDSYYQDDIALLDKNREFLFKKSQLTQKDWNSRNLGRFPGWRMLVAKKLSLPVGVIHELIYCPDLEKEWGDSIAMKQRIFEENLRMRMKEKAKVMWTRAEKKRREKKLMAKQGLYHWQIVIEQEDTNGEN